MLGNGGSRLPFLVAGILNGLNLVLTYFTLSESRRAAVTSTVVRFNPFAGIRRMLAVASLLPLIATYGLIELIANLIGTLWLLFGHDRLHWNDATLGASLATLGLFHVVSFAFLAAPLATRLGERRAIVVGIVCDCIAMISIGTAAHGWVAFAVAPLFALGSIGVPVLQASMTKTVDSNTQGELQGVLTSIVSLASIIGPLVASGVYAVTARAWPGGAWLLGLALYALTIPLLRTRPSSVRARPRSLERSAA
jgi:DHA1 family tetracycline resistance protein-like MFS transporter